MNDKVLVRKTRTGTLYYIDAEDVDLLGKFAAVNTARADNGAVGTHTGSDLELVKDAPQTTVMEKEDI